MSEKIWTWLDQLLAEHYRIGRLESLKRLDGGFINTSFEIRTCGNGPSKRYLLRCYEPGRSESEIHFEHSLLMELVKRDFELAPIPIRTKTGDTFLRVDSLDHLDQESAFEVYMAVFSYLPGEDRFSWDGPACGKEEIRDAATVLGSYHNTIYRWDGGRLCDKVRTLDLLPEMTRNWQKYKSLADSDDPFDAYFVQHSDYLFSLMEHARVLLDSPNNLSMPEIAVHGDYHPGNLRFDGSEICGLLDFDWAKMDVRSFDVGLALTYFCVSWREAEDGRLLLDQVKGFLDAYQREVSRIDGIGPMGSDELHTLPEMILLSNLFVLNWVLDDYYSTKPLSPQEYLRYLKHCVGLACWLDQQWNEIARSVMASMRFN